MSQPKESISNKIFTVHLNGTEFAVKIQEAIFTMQRRTQPPKQNTRQSTNYPSKLWTNALGTVDLSRLAAESVCNTDALILTSESPDRLFGHLIWALAYLHTMISVDTICVPNSNKLGVNVENGSYHDDRRTLPHCLLHWASTRPR